MERLEISAGEDGVRIGGFPDAVKVVELDGPEARRLGHLWLHKVDLDFAADCLDDINRVPDRHRQKREALWRCAVVHYTKCFGVSKARFRLDAEKILRAEPLGLECHKFFIDLRNKHLVHDENSYARCLPGALINRGDKSYKVEKIACIAQYVQTLDQENWNNLRVLVDKAHAWVSKEFDSICERLTKTLESEPYEGLLSRKAMTLTTTSRGEVGRTRDA